MKNEFFGDLTDYRKYDLLRILSGGKKDSSAVCWMLTPNKGKPTPTGYLDRRKEWAHFNEGLFDALYEAAVVDRERNVVRAEHPDILDPTAFCFYKEPFDNPDRRVEYFRKFLSFARGRDLVFFDPDKGLRPGKVRPVEWISLDELAAAFQSGLSVLVIQFLPFARPSEFVDKRLRQIFRRFHAREIASFQTPNVVFFLIPQAQHSQMLRELSDRVKAEWVPEIRVVWHSQQMSQTSDEIASLDAEEKTMKKTQQFLAKLKLPGEDNHALQPTKKRFPDGGQYRIEIPSVEGPRVFREVLAAAKEHKVPIHRVSQGSGIMLLTKNETSEMARIGAEHRLEVCLFVGPRASFETGAQALTAAGKVIGLQHRGADQLVYAIEDVRRACELGIRSVLPADLGLIWVLNEMKKKGELPKNLVIKSSVTLPAANPATARIFESLGVTTINVPTDLSPAQFGAIRQAVDIPIDTYIEVPDNFGGFIRYYEMPQLIGVAAPLYLKFGLRNAPDIYPSGAQLEDMACRMGRERVRRARIALDLMDRYAPQTKMSPLGSKDLGIPEV